MILVPLFTDALLLKCFLIIRFIAARAYEKHWSKRAFGAQGTLLCVAKKTQIREKFGTSTNVNHWVMKVQNKQDYKSVWTIHCYWDRGFAWLCASGHVRSQNDRIPLCWEIEFFLSCIVLFLPSNMAAVKWLCKTTIKHPKYYAQQRVFSLNKLYHVHSCNKLSATVKGRTLVSFWKKKRIWRSKCACHIVMKS